MDKINLLRIVKDHFSTFRRFDTGQTDRVDYLVFLGIPFAIASLVTFWLHFSFSSGVLNALLSGFSIFAGLLLNLLVLICGFSGSEKFSGFDAASTNKRRFLREIHQNLSFAILNAIAVVVIALVGLCRIWYLEKGHELGLSYPIIAFFTTFLLANFILTLLMVLRRIHYLLADEFAGPRSSKRTA